MLLIEQVRHRHFLRCIDELLLRLRQISREARDTTGLEPHAPIRHLDVRKHIGLGKLVL
jgi:hypothetical protein